MDEFVKILTEYGLELDFMIPDGEEELRDDLDNIMYKVEGKNAFEGLLEILTELIIRVRDFEKLSKLINIPEQYKHLGPVVENNICLEMKKYKDGEVSSFFMLIEGESISGDFILDLLHTEPEKLGVATDEFKLKKVFNSDEAVKDEYTKIQKLLGKMVNDREVKKGLAVIQEKVRRALEPLPDDPDWYLEYGKKNELFLELVEEVIGIA